jgi:hypothetical protein
MHYCHHDSGTATVSEYFNAGDGIDFSLELSTTAYARAPENVVPIPGSLLLLSSGLLGLVGFRRKLKK